MKYDNFLKQLDSVRAQEISYEDYIQGRDILTGDLFEIKVIAKRKDIFTHLEEDRGQYDETREVFWASGACTMIRREVLDRTGVLDTVFFSGVDDQLALLGKRFHRRRRWPGTGLDEDYLRKPALNIPSTSKPHYWQL